MSIALSEFWTRLVRSGITDAAGCKQLATTFTEANGGTPPSESVTLAKFMLKAGRLTRFQARALLADQAQEIRVGSYVIRSDKASMPLSQWVEVARVEDGQSGFLFRASQERLAGGRSQWVDAHIAVTTPSLQAFEPEPYGTSTVFFSPLPAGRCLHEVIRDGGSLPARDACGIGVAIADALHAMHALGLIHGSVRPDRVWMTDRGQAILLRDPAGPPTAPSGDVAASWFDRMDPADAYAAPEFASDEQACNQATDIYSLGCLLFRVVSGRPPFDSLAEHVSETPPELAGAILAGESGDPLYRVIAFAMAKSTAARFATAQQLATALSATVRLLPQADKAATVVKTTKTKSQKAPVAALTKAEKATKAEKEAAAAPKGAKKPSAVEKVLEPPPPADRPARRPAAQAPPVEPARPPAESSGPPPDPRRARGSQPKPASAAPDSSPPESAASIQSQRPTPSAGDAAPESIVPTGSDQVAESTPAPAPGGDADSQDRAPRRRKKKKKSAPLVLGALCIAVLMLMIGLVVRDPTEPVAKKKPRPPIPAVIPRVSSDSSRPAEQTDTVEVPTSENVSGYQLVSDDRLLFVPPYAADTPSAPLDLLPPGPAVVISVRLASITESEFGSKLIESLSPELDSVIGSVAARAKVPLDAIARCSAAMFPGKDGWPEISLAIELKQPQSTRGLIEKWQVTASRTPDGVTIYAGDAVDSDAFYLANPDTESDTVSRFAIGSVRRISEVAAAEGGAIALPRSLQTLWDSSSDQADLVLLITPNFLFADGRSLLQSSAPELVRPLKSVLIPDVAGAIVTAHVGGPQVFAEARFAPSGGISEAALMRAIRDSIQSWPTWADEFVVDSVPDPSWRLLASRLPSMMRFVVDQVRYGISGNSVVTNLYLPPQAVPQVTLATLLAMNTSPAGGTAKLATAQPTPPLTLEQMLERRMSVEFGQESLEFAIDAIVGDFKRTLPAGSTLPPVRIIGGDLQLMGITQNQQVRDFSKSDVPLRTVLTDLVLGANPDKTATGPKDPKQALIWVVADDPENPGEKVIFVTTRQAAEGKYELPREFRTDS